MIGEVETTSFGAAETWRRIGPPPRRLLIFAGAGCLAVLIATAFAPILALRAWLAAAVLWTSLPIGALALLMMIRLIPGQWSSELTAPMEAAVLLIPLAALVFLPILVGMSSLYDWTAQEQRTAFRSVYLSEWFFALRTILWFATLGGLAFLLLARRAWSTPVSCLGLIVFAVFDTFIATDWVMSLDPEFNSSGFGLYVMSIQIIVAMAVGIMAALVTSRAAIHRPQVLGGLLLTALLLWAYFAFMQFVIIWSADFSEEASWYLRRSAGAWSGVLWALAILHALPTFLLMLPPVLRRREAVMTLATIVLLAKVLEAAWLVLPARGLEIGWSGGFVFIIAALSIGALFAAAFVVAFRARMTARAPDQPSRETGHG